MPFLIILTAIWSFPVIAVLTVFFTRKSLHVRKWILRISTGLSLLTIICLKTNISTTFQLLDWVLISLIYFTIAFVLWIFVWHKKIVVRVISIIFVSIIFGIGYFSGTVGIIGVGFVVGSYEPSREIRLSDEVIYKELPLGNAISDFRGKRVEAYRTLPWFPFIEWQVTGKNYFELITYMNDLNARFDKNKKIIYLSTSDYDSRKNEKVFWSDSIRIGD